MDRFDVCVIGAGMIGSATAKYLSIGGARTCLIGPAKPAKRDDQKRDVFDCWSDIVRITHTLFTDVLWSYLAIESIKRYASIEQESGVNFFTDRGYLVLSDSLEYIKENDAIARRVGVDHSVVFNGKDELEKKFPMLKFSSTDVDSPTMYGIAEPRRAGVIDPIKLVEAQRILFEKHGGTMLDDVVVRVERRETEGDAPFVITTKSGTVVRSGKVVICAGAFLAHNRLLPDDCRLDVYYRPSVTFNLRFDPPEPDTHSLLSAPPLVLIPKSDRGGSLVYTGSPMVYPDGKYYLKIGYLDDSSKFDNRALTKPSEVTEACTTDVSNHEEIKANGRHLAAITKDLYKDLSITDIIADTCCFVKTSSGRPYIGSVAPNWYVVTGDNGFSAKSSDEIGRVTAAWVHRDEWICPVVSKDDLKVKILS